MAKLSGVAFKSGKNKGMHKSAVCAGLNSTGKNKGRLKPGFKWQKNKPCPVPVKSAAGSTKKPAKKKSAAKDFSTAGIEARRKKAAKCAGIVKSGAKQGKLKKGYKYPGGGKCPVKA